ncbi:family 78 glycoside hydrolase catalytic domain [Spirosoma fluviale]|uniref:Alpha-L-rhamnosidase N-terminal domain-containing protein n=1 Tax=Spirosoma fluviale TaxID=1597977 RepID=A0A286G9Z9_9BACT|nr:family 78 glycoside hydrolase catalytic domain [Spirosoma fluviale]SOD92351.1 Alpha-L-rhamnosidase N-terminal domain-containing protein [Spirosoma fluviale]
MTWFRILFFVVVSSAAVFAQTPTPDWTNQYWPARWILHPTAPARQYGIYHVRKAIELTQKPARFVVHVSADNRYRLFVNGKSVAMGPARSDTQNWNYETLDLAPYLQAGHNVLAAQVWYMGEGAPFAQMSYQLGFLMQGDGETEKVVNTDASWKIYQNPAYSPIKNDIPKLKTYIVAGDGDRVDAAKYPWGWEQPNFDDKAWVAAKPLSFATKPRGFGTDGNWQLVPRTIPMMEEGIVRMATVRRSEKAKMDNAFLQGKAPTTVAANTKAVFLLDQGHLTNAYPELTVSQGKGATITLVYAEALVNAKNQKGNRNEVEGRTMLGFEDQFVADGSSKRTFRPLWFRTYRYLQLTVETKDEPLVLDDLLGQFTGYPFQEKARFAASDTTLKAIWNVGWRTARLCAGETYYDCPYYEQLQYTGDTRIQSLISLYVAGDDRLMRKAIQDYDHSRFNDGLTQSRYPSADFQVIPTFSLFWVCMVHDYWMHRQDDAFIKSMLPGILSVLEWHEKRMAKTGLNGPLEWWNFVDWSAWKNAKDETSGGVPAGARKGGSSILSLQQAYTYFRAGDLLAHYGQNERAEHYRELGRRLNKAVFTQCWDAGRGEMADQPIRQVGTPDKTSFSQHANILAVLTDAVPASQQAALLQKTMTDTTLTQATFYFKFYLFEALKKTGLGDQFVAQLKPWRDMLAMGLTTFAENPEPTRSDCHAWSASPLYEFLSTTCGIRSAEPGFKSVRIEPFLGELITVDGKMPHPSGEIAVQFQKAPTGGLTGTVTLPANLTGTLRWKGKSIPLKSGKQTVSL